MSMSLADATAALEQLAGEPQLAVHEREAIRVVLAVQSDDEPTYFARMIQHLIDACQRTDATTEQCLATGYMIGAALKARGDRR